MKFRFILDHCILVVGAVIMSAPLLMVFLATTHAGVSGGGFGTLDAFWENYQFFLTEKSGFHGDVSVGGMAWNSLVLAIGLAAFRVVLSLMAAYAIIVLRLPRADWIFGLFLFSIMLPLESRFLPTHAVVSDLGLINSHLGLILPLAASGIGILFFRQFLMSLPVELMETARLDGAGPFRFFADIIVPLSMPMAKALFLVTFVNGWNQYLWPIIATTEEARITLIGGLRLFGDTSLRGYMLICVSVLPPALLVLFFQRQFVRGLYDGQH